MANFWPAFWADIAAAIGAAWPDVTTIFRAPQVERVNWYSLIVSEELTPPYAVVSVRAEQDEQWGLVNTVYRCMVAAYYVCETSGYDVAADIEAKMKALQDALQDPGSPWAGMIVLDTGFVTDVTEYNAITRSMLEADMPLSAGALTFHALVGESAAA